MPALDYFKAVLALHVLPQSDRASELHMHQVISHPAAASTLTSRFQYVQQQLPNSPTTMLQPGMRSACPAFSRLNPPFTNLLLLAYEDLLW